MDVALARPVTQLPTGPSWAYEIKVDGHRTVLWRTEDGVRLQSRTGRDVTALWMDLAVAAMSLPPGVILDGEAVVYLAADDGSVHISFAAAQSRALSRPRRARELADQHPATYVAFDILAHPAAGFPDLRPRPYVERRQVLLDVLADVGPPIVPVWSTTDLDEALLWYETLGGTGVEGLVAKPLWSAYKAGRVWAKVRNGRNCISCNTLRPGWYANHAGQRSGSTAVVGSLVAVTCGQGSDASMLCQIQQTGDH